MRACHTSQDDDLSPSEHVPLTRLTALLRRQQRWSGTIGDAQQSLSAARLPATYTAAFAMLRKAEQAGELTLSADGRFSLLGVASNGALDPPSEHGSGAASSSGARIPDDAGAWVRIVAFDVEAAVRAKVEDGGALTRQIWQLGQSGSAPTPTGCRPAPGSMR